MALGGTLGIGIGRHEDLAVMLSEPTVQEEMITTALHNSIAQDTTLWVHCKKDSEMADDLGRVPELGHTGLAIPVIYLKQSVCDGFSQYAASRNKNMVTAEEMNGIDIPVHEGEHVVQQDGSEFATQCRAFQRVVDFVLALDATPAQAHTVQEAEAVVYFQHRPAEYLTRQCYDGGPYDLDPASPGVFPYFSDGHPQFAGK